MKEEITRNNPDIRNFRIAELKRLGPEIHTKLIEFCSLLDDEKYPEAVAITKGEYKTLIGFQKIYERLKRSKKKEKIARKRLKKAEKIILSMASLKRDTGPTKKALPGLRSQHHLLERNPGASQSDPDIESFTAPATELEKEQKFVEAAEVLKQAAHLDSVLPIKKAELLFKASSLYLLAAKKSGSEAIIRAESSSTIPEFAFSLSWLPLSAPSFSPREVIAKFLERSGGPRVKTEQRVSGEPTSPKRIPLSQQNLTAAERCNYKKAQETYTEAIENIERASPVAREEKLVEEAAHLLQMQHKHLTHEVAVDVVLQNRTLAKPMLYAGAAYDLKDFLATGLKEAVFVDFMYARDPLDRYVDDLRDEIVRLRYNVKLHISDLSFEFAGDQLIASFKFWGEQRRIVFYNSDIHDFVAHNLSPELEGGIAHYKGISGGMYPTDFLKISPEIAERVVPGGHIQTRDLTAPQLSEFSVLGESSDYYILRKKADGR